ncbi:MAG: thermonuclease family protein [Pseudomonadota bacterium]
MVRAALALILMIATSARADNPPAPPAMPAMPVESAPVAPPPPQEYEGAAAVLDGSALQIGEERLLLFGIAAPNPDTASGLKARLALDALLAGDNRVHCVVAARDRLQRKLAICRLGDIDLSEALLLAGVATVDRYATRAEGADPQLAQRYDQAEAEARRMGAGLWAEFAAAKAAAAPEPFATRLLRFLETWQAGLGSLSGLVLVAGVLLVTRRRGR